MFDIRLHYVLFRFVNQDFCPVLNFFSKFGCWIDLFVWIVFKLVIQNILWNSSMEHSGRFTTDAGMIASIMIEDC